MLSSNSGFELVCYLLSIMEEIYDLHQHKNCVVILLKDNEIDIDYFSTSMRNSLRHEEFIAGHIISLKKTKITGIKIDTGSFHCVFVVPSEWEEEIRETIIRPIFVKANLISNEDHQDVLLFCSDLEAMYYYYATSNDLRILLERGENTVICRIGNPEENKVSIKLDFSALHPLFDFSDSLMFIKIIRSKSFSFTIDDIKTTCLPIDLHYEIIQTMEDLYLDYEDGVYDIVDTFLMEPLISDTSE
ncbi:hypothetical protein EDC94DRAFT_651607 [Helicostylum pulchrum]|nr:hypothetical protein EDC94DRAFT_651607 [Helicostylum pulchrum]